MVWAKPGLEDGLGTLEGIQGSREIPEGAQYVAEIVEAAAHIGLMWAKPRLEDRVGTLEELPRLLKLGPPPQVGADLVEQAGGGLWVTTEAAGMVGDGHGMGEQPGAGGPCQHVADVGRKRGSHQPNRHPCPVSLGLLVEPCADPGLDQTV